MQEIENLGGKTLLAISFPQFSPTWEHKEVTECKLKFWIPRWSSSAPDLKDGPHTHSNQEHPHRPAECSRGAPSDLPEMWKMQERKNASLGSTFTEFGSSLHCTCFPTPPASYYCSLHEYQRNQ